MRNKRKRKRAEVALNLSQLKRDQKMRNKRKRKRAEVALNLSQLKTKFKHVSANAVC